MKKFYRKLRDLVVYFWLHEDDIPPILVLKAWDWFDLHCDKPYPYTVHTK